jgi:hypothetical protein
MILPKERDPCFITIRHGGTLTHAANKKGLRRLAKDPFELRVSQHKCPNRIR